VKRFHLSRYVPGLSTSYGNQGTDLQKQQPKCATSVTSAVPADSDDVAASLYRKHEKSLKGYVLRLVPNGEFSHAEDVVQETFVRTITHLNNGKTVESPTGFLFTTARNLITSMFYRGRKNTWTDSQADMDEHASNPKLCSPEQRAFMQQKLDAFSTAIAALPERYQEAFVRRRIWGESCKEIAAKMQLSESVVSNYAALGWKLLGEYCDKHGIVLSDFFDQE